jgi:predicted phosphoribosyltransferase
MEPESSHNKEQLLKQPSPYPNLRAAGRELAVAVETYRDEDPIVLGIAAGGVPAAHEVAKHLEAPFDLVLIRRLLAPEGPGSQLCAINVAGSMIHDDGIKSPATPSSPIEYFMADALAEFERRVQNCRGSRPPLPLNDRTVLLVDCGIRTGLTMKAAIGGLGKLKPKRIIGAVPVTSSEGSAAVADLLDEMVCLLRPEVFGNAGVWYRDFSRPDDAQIGELLETYPQITQITQIKSLDS